MSLHLVMPLIQGGFCLALGVLIARGHIRNPLHRLFVVFLLGLAAWGLIIFGMRSSPNPETAYLWERWLPPLATCMAVVFYHFSVEYAGVRVRRWIFASLYTLALSLIPLSLTKFFIAGMQVKPYGYAPVYTPTTSIWMALDVILAVLVIRNFVTHYKTSVYVEEKNRTLYIIMALVFALVGGIFDVIPLLGLPAYPGFIVGIIGFCIFVTIAILKHNLLDIRVVLRRGTTYVLTSAALAIPFLSIFVAADLFLHEEDHPLWIYGILIFVLALAIPPLWRIVQQRIDKWFYRDRYDYLKALETFSLETKSFSDANQLISTLMELITGALKPASVNLLQPLPFDGNFHLVASVGRGYSNPAIELNTSSPLVKWLRRSDSMLMRSDLDIIPQLQNLVAKEKEVLARVGADLIVPFKTSSGELSGILILGKKASGQAFTVEDKQLIYTLSQQMATSLETARLYSNALRARENLETLLDSMSDGVMIVGIDYTIQFINKAAVKKLGAGVGRTCWMVLGKGYQCEGCPMPLFLSGSKDGRQRVTTVGDTEYEVASAPLLNPDASVSVTEVFRDITTRKRMEEERRELERKAQLANRLASVGEMASGIAHEINNPLTGVIGFSQLLMQMSDIPDNIRDRVKNIHNGAQRVADIVRRLLTFARQQKPERVYANINEILETTLALRKYELETNNIKVTTQFDSKLPRTMADAGQLQQVFLNILINAEQAIRSVRMRGNILINTGTIGDSIRISFKDDGPGISKENMSKIFNPFFTTREVGRGTGLGLSICHGIVTEHHGKIWAESELGHGATFIVELPIVPQIPSSDKPVETEYPKKDKVRILIVDDEPTIQQFLNEALSEAGYKVEAAGAARAALEKIRRNRYSLIFLDIKMPGMTGIELYGYIEKIEPALLSRVVFITGDTMGTDTRDFLAAKDAAYITKPITIEDLKKQVSRTLAS